MPVRERIPELALGVAPGDVRASALEHLTGCAECRGRLRRRRLRWSTGWLLLAPAHDPPPGFESRGARYLRHGGRRRRTVLLAVAAAVLAAVAGAGITRWVDDNDLDPAARRVLAGGGAHHRLGLRGRTGVRLPGSSVLAVRHRRRDPVRRLSRAATTNDGHANPTSATAGSGRQGFLGRVVDVSLDTVERIELAHPDGAVATAELKN